MQKIINFVRGSVKVEIKGAYPERFLNLCARCGIRFYNMKIIEMGIFQVDMRPKDFLLIRPIAKKSMCRVSIVSKGGLPFLFRRVRRRNLLIAGCAAFCVCAWIFTGFVWTVEIDGFESLDREKLMGCLEAEGLRRGVWASDVDVENLRNSILIKMPELSYIYVNFSGAEAKVIARARKSPPEILSADEACDIVADRDGIINAITVKTGTAQVKRGDTVMRGDLLASGYVTGREGTTLATHADAEISARTWTHISARMPKKYNAKNYTGREKKCYAIILFGRRIKLYQNSGISYIKCDKIINRTELSLFECFTLPIVLECATYREFLLSDAYLRDEDAFGVMGQTLNEHFSGEDGREVLFTSLATSSDDAFAYATLNAECVEKIGVKRKLLKDG